MSEIPSIPKAPGSALARRVFARTRSSQFKSYLKDLLLELCRIDTTPDPDVEKMRRAEEACFRVLERELSGLMLASAQVERRPINPAIKAHSNYSLLHFTKTRRRPNGLSPEETYRRRGNLLCHLPGTGKAPGQSVALNAHVDVVAPYIAPQVRGGTVFGRGACDDKGSVVSIVAALKVLSAVLQEAGLALNRNVLAMFVVEEEPGGNGSLSLAMDRELKREYDSLLVAECTELRIHPANRGAVWYRAELRPPAGASAFEMFAFVNEALEREGAAIRAESRHELFPQRPVQTCHGILGPFGEHPSRICGEVRFAIQFERPVDGRTEQLVRDCLENGLAGYIGLYGDKTKVMDAATGKPMVRRHYEIHRSGRSLRVYVYGAPGHMGAIRERDGAITKTAHLLRSLLASRERLSAVGGRVKFALEGIRDERNLILEGGQGFVPTHPIEEVMMRLRRAAQQGAEDYLCRLGRPTRQDSAVKVSFEKLHNVAFDGNPRSLSVRNAIAAAKLCGIWRDEPVLGWTVSCDARLFATEYAGMDVLTFGAGRLVHAHSDHEQIELDDIRRAAEFLTLFLLRQTGTVPSARASKS